MTLINKRPIDVNTHKEDNKLILDLYIDHLPAVRLTVPEAIELIRKIEERL
jgi:hypothetical protein